MFDEAEMERIAKLEKKAALHTELLYAVASAFPDETRHETALRYIKQAERRCNGPEQNNPDQQEIDDGLLLPL